MERCHRLRGRRAASVIVLSEVSYDELQLEKSIAVEGLRLLQFSLFDVVEQMGHREKPIKGTS